MTTRELIVGAALAVTVLGGAVAWRGRARRAAPAAAEVEAADDAREAAARPRPRAAATTRAAEASPAPETPPGAVLLHDPPAPRPKGPATTIGALFAEYRDAVCACATRACVRGLQDPFIRRLHTVSYNAARDDGPKGDAHREARRCIDRLPEGS